MKRNFAHISALCLMLLCLAHASEAQRKWDNKYYEKLTDETFRDFKLFNKPINLKKIDY